MKAGKVWGGTEVLLATPVMAIHRLTVFPFAACSLHRHATRWNAFVVSAGRLLIEVQQRDYDLTDVTELLPGQLTTVAPGLWHRFRTEDEGAELTEIYYPATLELGDIERQGTGSRSE